MIRLRILDLVFSFVLNMLLFLVGRKKRKKKVLVCDVEFKNYSRGNYFILCIEKELLFLYYICPHNSFMIIIKEIYFKEKNLATLLE